MLPISPYLVECYVTAHMGDRPFGVWQVNVEDVLERLEKAEDATFRLCTLKKTKPCKPPRKL